MLSLNLLANQALIYILNNLLLHIIPQKVLPHVFVHFGSPWMYKVLGVLSFFQDLFPQLGIFRHTQVVLEPYDSIFVYHRSKRLFLLNGLL